MRSLKSLWLNAARSRGVLTLALASVLALGGASAAGGAVIAGGGGAAALAASCGVDEFEGTALDDARWDVIRPTEGGHSVADGALSLEIRNGDYINDRADAQNTVLQDAPAGGFTATTRFNISAIDQNGEQAGIVLWKSEGSGNNTFGKVMFIQTSSEGAGARVMESIWTDRSGLARPIPNSRAAVPALPADADVQVRVRSDGDLVRAEFSVDDGETWTQVGQTARYSGDLRVGLVAVTGGQPGGFVPFEFFDLECGPTVTAEPASGAAPLEVDLSASLPVGATDIAWGFGDGDSATGGTEQTHTFDEPGAYRVRVSATVDGTPVAGSTLVTVPTEGPSDEFDGNALDPEWEVLRPRDTGIEVSDGQLRLLAYGGDMYGGGASARNVLLKNAPAGGWTAETELDLTRLTGNDQAGMIVWRGENPNNFAKIVFNRRSATAYWVERANTVGGNVVSGQNAGQVSPIPATLRLRVVAAADGTLRAEASQDGETWTAVGDPFQVGGTGPLKVGLTYFSGASMRQAGFNYFRLTPGEQSACAPAGAAEPGFERLWNGTDLTGWVQSGPGRFEIVDDGAQGCRLVSRGGLGLLWNTARQYDQFVLRMQWRTADATDNSGVFVRFPNAGSVHQTAISQGHEIQIREGVEGDGENQKTGSIYNFDREDARAAEAPGEWNDYEIRYEGGTYTVMLNGQVVNTWANDGRQGVAPGYIGLQNHGAGDEVSFRNIRVRRLTGGPSQPVNIFTTIGLTEEGTKANVELRGGWSLPSEEMPPSRQIVAPGDDEDDDVPLRMPNTSGTVDNLAEFRGQTIVLREQELGNYARLHFFGTTTDGGPAGGDFVLRYSDGTEQTVNVRFPDWCQMGNTAGNWHPAIGPLSHRHTPTGQDGAPCGIFHVPADADAAKTLVSVTLPPSTAGGGVNTRSYLMALTLEDADGGFVTPDLGASPFPDDLQPPTSSHELAPAEPDGDNGWYTDEVQIALAAVDEDDGENEASGLERTEYRVDGGDFRPYDEPFTVSGDGRHVVEYRSVDRAGNTETPRRVPVNIDGTAPATLGSLDPGDAGADGWYDRPVALTLRGRDGNGSGADAFEYRVGGGSFAPYTGPVVFDDPGTYEVSFRSTDVAGNTGDASSLSFRVDGEAPTTTATLNGAAPAQNFATGPVTVALSAADRGSGAASTQFAVDGGDWRPYTRPFGVSGDGVHVVAFRSIDAAGNIENAKEAVFRIGRAVQRSGDGGATFPPAEPAPEDDPWVGLVTPAEKRATVDRLRRGKLSIGIRCRSVDRGVLRIRVSRKAARRLGVGRTLARETFTCEPDGRVSVRFDPSRKVRRALRRSDRRWIAAVLTVRTGTVTDRQAIRLRGKRRG